MTPVTVVTAAETLRIAAPLPTGDGARTGDGRAPWTAFDDWRVLYRQARDGGERAAIVLAWGEAAGGVVRSSGDDVRLELPGDLPNCLALVELRRLARDVRVLA